jgi:hypothetical protein
MGEGGTEPYEVLNGIRSWRYPAPPATSGFVSYVWEFLYCWLRTAWLTMGVFGRYGFDVIHTANPPDTFWAIALPFKLVGVKFVFDHHDLCPELYLSRFGPERAGSLPHRLLGALERAQFACADLVISTNESYRQVLLCTRRKTRGQVEAVRSGPATSASPCASPTRRSSGQAPPWLPRGDGAAGRGPPRARRAARAGPAGRRGVHVHRCGGFLRGAEGQPPRSVRYAASSPRIRIRRWSASSPPPTCVSPTREPAERREHDEQGARYMARSRRVLRLREHRHSAGEGRFTPSRIVTRTSPRKSRSCSMTRHCASASAP